MRPGDGTAVCDVCGYDVSTDNITLGICEGCQMNDWSRCEWCDCLTNDDILCEACQRIESKQEL